MSFSYIIIGLGLACWAIMVVAGMAITLRKDRVFVADCVGIGGFIAGVTGVLLKLLSVPLQYLVIIPELLQNMVSISESLPLWMCVILILSSTAIMMLSKIYEVLVTLFNKDDSKELRGIAQHMTQQLIEINRKEDSKELRDISQHLREIKRNL